MKMYDRATIIRLTIVFVVSFLLNFVWEHLHSVLYAHYQGNPITNLILLKATLGDALFIAALSIPFHRIYLLRDNMWLIIPLGVAAAILLELFATSTGRWAYTDLMPLVPLIGTGLTPTIQLGLLAFATLRITEIIAKRSFKIAP